MEKKIYVYENWSSDTPKKLGTLFIHSIRGGEHSSFQFDPAFLADACTSQMLMLDPDLSLVKGRQFPAAGKSTFGIFSDSSPDRWGRLLMERREKLNADKDDRKPNKLLDSDYLLGVYDESRMGALRFALEDGGAFLSDDKETAAPPWATLRTLEQASREFEKDENALIDKWLNQLLRPGSSLGGARPKATVQDPNGEIGEQSLKLRTVFGSGLERYILSHSGGVVAQIQHLALICLHGGCTDGRTDDIGLVSLCDLLSQESDQPRSIAFVHHKGIHLLSAGRHFVDCGKGKISVQDQRKRAWNGSCTHHHDVRVCPLFLQARPLHDAKAVLFIRDDQTQP